MKERLRIDLSTGTARLEFSSVLSEGKSDRQKGGWLERRQNAKGISCLGEHKNRLLSRTMLWASQSNVLSE